MGITKKTLFLIVIIFIFISALMLLLRHKALNEIEPKMLNSISLNQAQKIESLLQSDKDRLLASAKDWGYWNDNYKFIHKNNPNFIKNNFSAGDALSKLNIDAMLFFDSNKQFFYGYKSNKNIEINLLKLPKEFEFILKNLDFKSAHTFTYIDKYKNVYDIAVSAITPTKAEQGNTNGSLVMINLLDFDFFKHFGLENIKIEKTKNNIKDFTSFDKKHKYYYKFKIQNYNLSTCVLLVQDFQPKIKITIISNQYDIIHTLRYRTYKAALMIIFVIAFMFTFLYWFVIRNNVKNIDILSLSIGELINSPEKAEFLPNFKDIELQRLVDSIKLMTSTLYEQKNMFEGLLEEMPMGVIIYQPNIVYVNKYFFKQFKTNFDRVKTLTPVDLLDSLVVSLEEKEKFIAKVKERTKNKGSIYTYETNLQLDGVKIDVLAVSQTIKYKGKSAGLVTFVDTTEIKKTESELSLFLQHSPIVFYHIKYNSKNEIKILNISDSVFELTGFYKDEISPDWWFDSLHPDDKVLAKKRRVKLLARGSLNSTYRMKRKDGSYVWVNGEAHIVKSGENEVEMVGFWSDSTKQEASKYMSKALSNINNFLLHAQDDKILLEKICEIMVHDGPFVFAWIGKVDLDGDTINPIFGIGDEQNYLKNLKITINKESKYSKGLAGSIVHHEKTVLVNPDTKNNKLMEPWKEEMLKRGFFSSAAVKITMCNDEDLILYLHSDTTHMFSTQFIAMLKTISHNVSFALVHIKNINRLKFLSYHDPLSGLPNVNALQEELETVKGPLSFCAMNIRDFSLVNLNYGYDFGNKVLLEIAKTIQNSIPTTDKLFRIGGDKFGLLVYNAHKSLAIDIATRIKKKLAKGMQIDSHFLPIYVRISLVSAPEDTSNTNDLYNLGVSIQGYSRGKKDIALFEPWMIDMSKNRILLERNIIEAIENESFEVYYQPIINMKNEKPLQCEALMRLNDKEGKPISPELMAKTAEEFGMISDITKIIIKKVIKQQRIWREKGILQKVAINISASDISNQNFFYMLEEQLIANGLGSDAISLELTERTAIENLEVAKKFILHAKSLGIDIEIDDFGVAQSSLNEISSIDFDILKIDKSFVDKIASDKKSRKVIEFIIYLAKEFNAKTIAEGVETPEQKEWLKNAGCDCIQGYLYSRPIPHDKYEIWLKGLQKDV
jgi:diguanylate cyclase (GGDEF)-like protein/PAS domain S-box-containing protein